MHPMQINKQQTRRSFFKVSGAITALTFIPSMVKAWYNDAKNFIVPKKKRFR